MLLSNASSGLHPKRMSSDLTDVRPPTYSFIIPAYLNLAERVGFKSPVFALTRMDTGDPRYFPLFPLESEIPVGFRSPVSLYFMDQTVVGLT